MLSPRAMTKGPKKGETIAFDFALLPPKPAPAPAAPADTAPDSPAPPSIEAAPAPPNIEAATAPRSPREQAKFGSAEFATERERAAATPPSIQPATAPPSIEAATAPPAPREQPKFGSAEFATAPERAAATPPSIQPATAPPSIEAATAPPSPREQAKFGSAEFATAPERAAATPPSIQPALASHEQAKFGSAEFATAPERAAPPTPSIQPALAPPSIEAAPAPRAPREQTKFGSAEFATAPERAAPPTRSIQPALAPPSIEAAPAPPSPREQTKFGSAEFATERERAAVAAAAAPPSMEPWTPAPPAERVPRVDVPVWTPGALPERASAPRIDGPPPSAPAWVPAPLPAPPPPATPAAKPDGPRVLTVGQLGRVVGRSLERTFAAELWVEGEVSGARPAASGHVYFSMKDEAEDASIDVVLYRSSVTPRGRALVKDGSRIRVRGKPTYWSPRGKLQFVGDRVEPTGKGALLEALEKLKEKLQAEGLFANEKKRALPHDPRVIGVVTSSSGAVIHDICKVAFRRGSARILLAPAQVQGPGAAESIRRALRMLQRVADVDVIVIGRGGGSSDDLLAFNDEQVVREVAACRVPIVSAVGHEVDVTLVDFAADARAATPSQAAEMIVPDLNARRRLLEERARGLERAMRGRLAEDRAEMARLMRAFGDPRLLIAGAQQRIDELVHRLTHLAQRRLANEKENVGALGAQLRAQHPQVRIARDRARATELEARLVAATRQRMAAESTQVATLGQRLDRIAPHLVRDRGEELGALAQRLDRVAPHLVRDRAEPLARLAGRLDAVAPHLVRARADVLARLAGRLDAMSPLKVLARGYAIVTKDGHAVRDATEVVEGDRVRIRVGEGAFDAEVKT